MPVKPSRVQLPNPGDEFGGTAAPVAPARGGPGAGDLDDYGPGDGSAT
ncbi:hypothetical protein [Streptomyces sp. NPDC127092]